MSIDTYLELALLQLVETEESFSREIAMDKLKKLKGKLKVWRRNKFWIKINELKHGWNDITLNCRLV